LSSGSSSSQSVSSSSSSSQSAGIVNCTCCNNAVNVPDTIYVKLSGLFAFSGFPTCNTPCDAIDDACFELTRTGACAWQGQLLTNASCYPVSTMQVNLTCTASQVTIVAVWIQSSSALTRYKKVINAPTIDCLTCGNHELNPDLFLPPSGSPGQRCNTSQSIVNVSFQPSAGCCQYCPDDYQVTIGGMPIPEAGSPCTSNDCQSFYGNYIVSFQESDVASVACTDGLSNWCHYSAPVAIPCTDTRFGFCEIHVYVRTNLNCTVDMVVELTLDANATGDFCSGSVQRNGWDQYDINQTCNTLDVQLDIGELCLDTGFLCDASQMTLRVQAV
jgi:hypothetical protein